MPPEDHFDRLRRWLDLESRAEEEQAAQRLQSGSGERATLTGLRLHDEDIGLGGFLLLTLGLRDRLRELPPHRFQPGKPALLFAEESKPPLVLRAVVMERSPTSVRVAIPEPEDGLPDVDVWRLEPSPDEVARQRQIAAMEKARAARSNRLAELRRVFLAQGNPEFGSLGQEPLLNSSLNESQEAAVRFALRAKDAAIVHGPPGTGKTTTLVEIIRQSVRRGEKVLACAPSNAAVDHLLDQLVQAGEKPVRLGHPARVSADLRDRCLDVLAESHNDAKTARKLTRDAHALFRQAGRWTRSTPTPGERQSMRREGRAMLDDARRLEVQAINSILDRASIICATLTGVDGQLLGERMFDSVILDEACQSTEPACWIPIGRARRVILAGDHCQLPPTILSQQAAAEGLRISFMERLVNHFGPLITHRLTTQYRMHQQIMQFSSDEFYDGELQADASVVGHLLRDLPNITSVPETEAAVRFIDTAGAGYDEELEPEGQSRCNPKEADLVIRQVRALLAAGVTADQMAIITPYAAQVRLLRERLLMPELEIDSVDGFQGREKEAIIVSFVRSNVEGEVGFLSDTRRTNVAMTRARRALILVGDSATLSHDEFYQRLITYIESIGAYTSVWELGDI